MHRWLGHGLWLMVLGAAAGSAALEVGPSCAPGMPQAALVGHGPMAERELRAANGRVLVELSWPLLLGEALPAGELLAVLDAVHKTATQEVGLPDALRRIELSFLYPTERPAGWHRAIGPGAASLVLQLPADGSRPLEALAHQLAHAELQAYATAPSWWSEASARWLARRALIHSGVELQARPSGSLGSHQAQADAFIDYLSQRYGPRILSRVWEQLGNGQQTPLEALRWVLELRGLELGDELRTFASWLLASAGDERLGELEQVDVLPHLAELEPAGMGPLGLYFLRLPAMGGWAGLDVRLALPGPERWLGTLLRLGQEGELRQRASLVDSAGGWLGGSVPSSDSAELVLSLVRLPGPEPEHPVNLTVSLLDPYPFVLDDVQVEPLAGGGLGLRWSVSSEVDVYGWRVLRQGPGDERHRPLTSGLIPAGGDHSSYAFDDLDVEPDSFYSYVVEAVGMLGFSQHGPLVGARSDRAR